MKQYHLLIICFFLLLFSCMDRNPDPRILAVRNNSSEPVYYSLSKGDSLDNDRFAYLENKNDMLFLVNMNETTDVLGRPYKWEDFINEIKDNKMRLFIISKDSVEKYGWKGVLKKNIYTTVYKLDINDLEKNKWLIEYNGRNR